jgi:hypothetical protein
MAGEITGFLHIVRLNAAVDPVSAEYRIAFAPLGGRLRGRHVTCRGLDGLTEVLQQAGVPIEAIERAWEILAKRRFHAIPRVVLTPTRIEELGF